MIKHPLPYGECECNHTADHIIQEITAHRQVQEYRERADTGEVILVCTECGGLWEHGATSKVIERIMAG